MVSDLPPSPTSDDIFTHIVLCLSDKIPGELFGEVMENVDFDTSTQTGLEEEAVAACRGGISTMTMTRDSMW
ncbi:uncharacterized protein A4U43_C01F17180 [Asparagus officinalis]|uniref:Uncharacterized protein n=1 Tax=Asparagus officinalis TaxID=4686 RepID=A0A5P1FQU4_ASPOF|nr:uncharacterized protein A4U43_C01F17180 [Asparagus officinalis]